MPTASSPIAGGRARRTGVATALFIGGAHGRSTASSVVGAEKPGSGDNDRGACHFGRATGVATGLLTGGADGRSIATNNGPIAVVPRVGSGLWGFHFSLMTGLTHNLPGKYDY